MQSTRQPSVEASIRAGTGQAGADVEHAIFGANPRQLRQLV